MALDKATLTNASKDGAEPIKVMFNPKELTITTNMLYPEISVPGLKMPLMQFIRGEARTMAAELYLDQSNSGAFAGRKADGTAQFRDHRRRTACPADLPVRLGRYQFHRCDGRILKSSRCLTTKARFCAHG